MVLVAALPPPSARTGGVAGSRRVGMDDQELVGRPGRPQRDERVDGSRSGKLRLAGGRIRAPSRARARRRGGRCRGNRCRAVKRTQALGVTRREYSLASKVLHWLLPWRVPVYDGFVRQSLGVPGARDHPPAYRQIVREEFAAVRAVTERNPAWVGSLEPRSPLRAFDKCLWWFGGGNVAAAAEVRRPWQVVDELGLDRC